MIASDRLFEPFNDGTELVFPHEDIFGGHPVSAAVALANLDIFEREGLNDNVKRQASALRATLERLYDLPIIGDVRGEGYFYSIELVKDRRPEKLSPARKAQNCCRTSPRRCSRPGCTAGPTTAATRRSSSHRR